jgi:hypothetical protein
MNTVYLNTPSKDNNSSNEAYKQRGMVSPFDNNDSNDIYIRGI